MASTPTPAAAPANLALLPPLPTSLTDLNATSATPFVALTAKPPDKASIVPIAKPLPTDLFLIF